MPEDQLARDERSSRALVVAPMPYYLEKGSTLRVQAMVERLVDAGYTVDVVCYPKGADPNLEGVTVTRAGIRALTSTEAGPSVTDLINDLFVAARALVAVWSTDYDRLQGEDVEGIAIVLVVRGLLSDAETVYDLHNPLGATLRLNGWPVPESLSRFIEGFLYRRVDQVLANWNIWTEKIRSQYGVDHVKTVYDTLPTDRREVDLPAPRYLVYVGNFKPYQGVDLLVDAFEHVAPETEVDLVLVGDPTTNIRDAVTASSAGDRIHLVGRYDIPAANHLLANAVAAVLPRRRDGQPGMKLLHYTMYDIPIIATALDCNRELERFDNPILWADPTPQAIADRLREVCRDV